MTPEEIAKLRIPTETTMGIDTEAALLLRPTRVSQPVESYGHPLIAQALDLCRAINACGGGPEMTIVTNRADALLASITNAVTYCKYLAAIEDEPTFTLRAKDRLAPFAVMTWAKDAELHGVTVDKVVGAQKIAFDMIQWPQRNGCKVPD